MCVICRQTGDFVGRSEVLGGRSEFFVQRIKLNGVAVDVEEEKNEGVRWREYLYI